MRMATTPDSRLFGTAMRPCNFVELMPRLAER